MAFGNLIINEDRSARESKIDNVVEGVPPSSGTGRFAESALQAGQNGDPAGFSGCFFCQINES